MEQAGLALGVMLRPLGQGTLNTQWRDGAAKVAGSKEQLCMCNSLFGVGSTVLHRVIPWGVHCMQLEASGTMTKKFWMMSV